jgi:hypothetical protein
MKRAIALRDLVYGEDRAMAELNRGYPNLLHEKARMVVPSVSPTRVALKSGATLNAHKLICAARLQGNGLVRSLGLDLGPRARIGVEGDKSTMAQSTGASRRADARRADDESQEGSARLGNRAPRTPPHKPGSRECDCRLGRRSR